MDRLKEAVKSCQSGAALVAAVEDAAGIAGGPIPGLIADCIAQLAAAEGATAQAAPAANGNSVPALGEKASLDSPLCVIDGLMFLSPRGKQQLLLFKHCLLVRTAKQDIPVPWSAIQNVAIIDHVPGDTKGKVLLYLHLNSEAKVMNGKQVLGAVVVQTTAHAQLDVAHPLDPAGSRLQGPAPVVLCQALGAVPGGPGPTSFVSPDPQAFQSAAKAAGVKAHVKARDGFLYPLPSALCFLDAPQLFLPHSRIASVELMRAGGASSTFDLVVHLKGGAAVEFGMIGRAEVAAIEDYIRKCRLAVGAAATSDEEEEEGDAAAEEEAEGDSDDPEDEDFNPSGSSDEEGAEARRRSDGGAKRKRADDAGGEAEHGSSEGSSSEDGDEDEDEDESDDESSDDGGSDVELVSEDEFSRERLQSMIANESGGRRSKRQRGTDAGS